MTCGARSTSPSRRPCCRSPSPVIALALVAIRLESKGKAIYRQRRVGRDGREFDVLKLRTMVDGAEKLGAGLAVDAGDARITRVGALLRRTSIDELPNLVNVLQGEMAIVGPRPTVPSQVAQYTERERGRLAIARASQAGRRSTAARRCRGRSASSSTSGTSSTAPGAWTSRSCGAARGWSSAATASTRARPAAGRRVSARA